MKKLFLSVPKLIELIHFNKDLPENHTISIKNTRSKVAKVYTGTEWKTMDEDVLVKRLINDFESTLEDFASEKTSRAIYIEEYNEIKERIGDKKMYQDLEKEVKNLIYDKRDMVKIK